MIFIQILLSILVATTLGTVVVNPLTGISGDNLVYSGTIPVSDTASSKLFFTYYGKAGQKSQDNLKNYPLIICVGSPGSSAQYLSLNGVGPLKLNKDMTLSPNPNSLNSFANTMFLDLLGSGYSFAASQNQIPDNYPEFGRQLTYAINAFITESALGQVGTIAIAGQGSFIRTLSALDDVDRLKGIIHISSWPQLYVIGNYYGVAGVDLKIFGNSQKIAIQSTFVSCYNYLKSNKFLEARNCYDTILNFVEAKTKNTNLYDVRLKSNLTQQIPLIQYYFSQAATVAKFKAPTTALFETQSNLIMNKTFVDQAKNYTKNLSQLTKDYLTVKHLFIVGDSDYICYRKGIRYWLDNQLTFVQSPAFRAKSLQDIVVDGQTVGYTKGVKQVTYMEILNSGHYVLSDQGKVMNGLIKDWINQLSQQKNNIRVVEALVE